MEFLTLNKIFQLLKDEDFKVKKHLGQNFLIDRNSKDKILSFADLEKDDTVIEIGPGLGCLTESLITKVKDLYAFEIDPKLCSILKKRFTNFTNFHLIEKDFLLLNEEWWQSMPSNLKVVSNTPYYISSQIIYNIIRFRKYIKTAILTVQKEVGEKTISSPGSKNYGPISVLNYIYTNSKICYSLSKDVFFPKPEVSSVVLKIKPLEKPKFQISEEKKFNDFLKHIFMLRRKKLINVVNKVFGLEKSEFEKISEANKIETGIRVENLTPEELYKFFLLINPKIK